MSYQGGGYQGGDPYNQGQPYQGGQPHQGGGYQGGGYQGGDPYNQGQPYNQGGGQQFFGNQPPQQRPGLPNTPAIRKLRWIVFGGIAVLLLCCGGFVYSNVFGEKPKTDAEIAAEASASRAKETPRDPEDAKHAWWAKVGDCVVKAPTVDQPGQMQKAPCNTKGSYTVLARMEADGTVGVPKNCPEGDTEYELRYHDDPRMVDFKLCLKQN